MKTIFLLSTFPKISETFILSQITGLIDLGADVEIIAFKKADTSEIHPLVEQYHLMEKVTYVSSKNATVRGLRLAGTMLSHPVATMKFFNKHQYHFVTALRSLELSRQAKNLASSDAIIAHYGPIGATVANLRAVDLLPTVNLITFFHGFDLTAFVKKNGVIAYKQLFAQKNKILTINRLFQEKLYEIGVKEEQVSVWHMGVNVDLFEFQPREIQSELKLLSVGRLVEKKGFDTTIEIVSKLINAGINTHLNIIGDGPLKEQLVQQITELNLQEHVTLLGSQNQQQVHEQIIASDFFVLMSRTSTNGDKEGIPVVLMEAMASGLPVISTLHSGIPELITDKESGWLVPEHDAQAGFEAVKKALQDLAKLDQIKNNARKKIELEFNSELLNQQLFKLCKKEDRRNEK